MPVWKCNDKCLFGHRINDNKVTYYRVDVSNETPGGGIEKLSFTKYMPYSMDLTLYIYIYIYVFEKGKQIINGYTISKINKTY